MSGRGLGAQDGHVRAAQVLTQPGPRRAGGRERSREGGAHTAARTAGPWRACFSLSPSTADRPSVVGASKVPPCCEFEFLLVLLMLFIFVS